MKQGDVCVGAFHFDCVDSCGGSNLSEGVFFVCTKMGAFYVLLSDHSPQRPWVSTVKGGWRCVIAFMPSTLGFVFQ